MAHIFGADKNEVYTDTLRKMPLVLALEKSPELLKLMDEKPIDKNDKWEGIRKFRAQLDSEKLKASNFPASMLEIGNWKREAKSDNDIVAKCYYAKKKLVWEVLHEGRKRKMEISWTDISALRATFGEGKPSTLEIELEKPPAYFVETEPQPRKHTMWITIDDFTNGQASNFRRHTLTVAEGDLEKHFEKLIYSSGLLYVLNRRPFPKHYSPLFNHNRRKVLPYASPLILPELYHQPYVNMIPPQVPALRVTPLSCVLPEFSLNSDQYPPMNEHNINVMPSDVMITHSADNLQPVIVWDKGEVGHAREFQEQPVSACTTLPPSISSRRVGLAHNANVYTQTEEYQEPESLSMNEGVYKQTEEYQEPQLDGFRLEDAGFNHFYSESSISHGQMDNSLQNYELVNDGRHNNICDPSPLMTPSSFNGIDEEFLLNYDEVVTLDIPSPSVGTQINEETWNNSD